MTPDPLAPVFRELVLHDHAFSKDKSESLMLTIRDLLRVIENSLDNPNVCGIQLVLRRPLPNQAKRRGDQEVNFSIQKIQFPAMTENESRRFVIVVKILKIIYTNLTEHKYITKRDLYYRDVDLFGGKQANADTVVDMLALSFDVPVYKLGILPAQKGLVFGDMKVEYSDGNQANIFRSNGPSLIPLLIDYTKVIVSDQVKYIVVLEKEAVFKSFSKVAGPEYLLITGKGYPDHLTQSLLSALSSLSLPIFGLVDSDSHGINIFLQYKFGHRIISDVNHSKIGGIVIKNRSNYCFNIKYLGVHITDYSNGWLNCSHYDRNFSKILLKKLHSNEFEVIENQISEQSDSSEIYIGSSFNSLFSQASRESQSTSNFSLEVALSQSSNGSNIAESLLYSSSQKVKNDNGIDKLARELQRQLYFNKKCEMNVIESDTGVTGSLYGEIDEENISIGEYIERKIAQNLNSKNPYL